MLDDPTYLDAANKAADLIEQRLYRPDTNTLLRSYREGAGGVSEFASDYAFVIQGLLDVYEASFDVRRLEWAMKLQQRQDDARGASTVLLQTSAFGFRIRRYFPACTTWKSGITSVDAALT
jgi:uncharacterized protein YyaL (SSP411 family)